MILFWYISHTNIIVKSHKNINNSLIDLQKNQDFYFSKKQIEYYLKENSMEKNKENPKFNYKK